MMPVANRYAYALALVTAALCVVLAGGCRLSFDKHAHFGGFPPRLHSEVRLLVLESESAGAEENATAWSSNPTVAGVERLSSEEARLLRENCKARQCDNPLQSLCEEAIANEQSYLIEYSSSADYTFDYVCTEYDSLFDKSPECISGHKENERTTASINLHVIDARRCERIKTRQWTQAVPGEEAQSTREVDFLINETAARMAREFVFPEQARLVTSPGGHIVPAPGSLVLEEGQLLAAFRGTDYLGLARARRAGREGLAVEPMSCCFTPRPDDHVQQRSPYHLVDFNVALALALQEENRNLASGLHAHLRRYPVIGGVMLGLSGDALYDGSRRLSMGNLEFGYQFKPFPGIELLAAATGGFGALQEQDMPSDLTAQIGALFGINWNPSNWWYVGVEFNFVRVFADEPFLDPRSPIARLSFGLEFH